MRRYEDDIGAEWVYGRALWTYRRHGDGSQARESLRRAVEANPYVVLLMLHPDRMPAEFPSHFVFGSPEEATCCVTEQREAWEATPGALPWLRQRAHRETASGFRHARRRGGRSATRR